MAFNKPLLNTIFERVKNDIVAKTRTGNPLARSFVIGISYALAGLSYLLHSHLDFIFKQVFPDTAEGQYLERWASIWGIYKKEGSYSKREVSVSGIIGAVIEKDSIMVDENGNQFFVDEELILVDITGTVSVTAEAIGTIYNLDAGSKVSFLSPISGIESEGEVLETGLINGTNSESDESLLGRLLSRIQEPPSGGKKNDYKTWAKEVSGVTRAWVYPQRLGAGTVGVCFVTDDDVSLIPSAAKVDEVQAYIDNLRPVTADLTVFAPTESAIDLTIQLNPNTQEVRDAVTDELKDLITRVSEPEGRIYISQLREAVSIALGEVDHKMTAPAEDVIAGAGEIKTLGEITFQTLVYE